MSRQLLLLFVICSPAEGQLVYDGPIIDRTGRYDGYPVHLELDGVHHIWFCGESPVTDRDAIFHSQKTGTLRDTSGWSQPAELLNINDVSWAQGGGGVHVCDPTVVAGEFEYQSVEYRLALYFTSDTTASQAGDNAIGVAFSNDGTSWTVHSAPVIEADGGIDGSYGAGAGGVAWGPEAGVLHHPYRDSTSIPDLIWRIRYKSSTDGLSFSPTPSLDTQLSNGALSGLGSAPEIAYFAPQNRWFAAIQEVAGGDELTGRILRAASTDDLFSTWTTVAGFNGAFSGEELLILPSIAKNENSSLYVDDEGWLYTFFTTGNNRGSGAGIDTWKISQARVRLLETTGSHIADGFANIGQNRAIDAPLNGTAAEIGGERWSAGPSWRFGIGSATVDSTLAGTERATIPFESSLSDRSTLEVHLDPSGTDWIAAGFSAASGAGLFGGEVWVQLNPKTAKAHLFAQGTNHFLGTLDLETVATSHTIRIEYSSLTNSASAWVDHDPIAVGVELTQLGFTPSLQTAGFHAAFEANSAPSIDFFRVNELGSVFANGFESGTTAQWSDVIQ